MAVIVAVQLKNLEQGGGVGIGKGEHEEITDLVDGGDSLGTDTGYYTQVVPTLDIGRS